MSFPDDHYSLRTNLRAASGDVQVCLTVILWRSMYIGGSRPRFAPNIHASVFCSGYTECTVYEPLNKL